MKPNSSTHSAAARTALIVSMLIFGTIGIFVKGAALPAAEVSLYRAAIASVILFLAVLFTGRLRCLRQLRGELVWLFVSGAAIGVNWILLFTSYQSITIAMATLCYYFSPTLVILGSVLLFRERLRPWQIFCFLASTAGLVLMVGVSGGGPRTAGIALALSAAFLYSIIILLNKKCGNVDGLVRTWIQFFSAFLVLLPYVLATGGLHLGELSSSRLLCVLVLGVAHTGLTYVLYFSSLPYLGGQEAAILSYIDPTVAVLVSVFVLHETTTVWQLVGGGMVILFALLNELPPRGKRPTAPQAAGKTRHI